MRVGIIGLGNMGTAVGNLIAHNGYEVLGWNFEEEVVEEINERHSNDHYLPGIPLHDSLQATTELSAVVTGCDVVLYIAEKLHSAIPLAKGLWAVINGRDQAEHFIYAFIKDFVD